MPDRNWRWLPTAVLITGIALRCALFAVRPPSATYDNHFEPIGFILSQKKLPSAADCWECYQPPLYYVIAAGATQLANGVCDGLGLETRSAARVLQKTIQLVSLLAGIFTLFVCRAILRQVPMPTRAPPGTATHTADPPDSANAASGTSDERQVTSAETNAWLTPSREALALGMVAFLPRHIHMSAMVTNDAFTYLVASLAVLFTLRAHRSGWRLFPALIAGALAGACVLSKAYGATVVAAIIAAIVVVAVIARRRADRHGESAATRGLAAVFLMAVLVGVWPAVRNVAIYGRPVVYNDELRDTAMSTQPPGAVGQVNFASFRLLALLRHPWLHMAHADSFATELYGRYWFDYEALDTSLPRFGPWKAHFDDLVDRYEKDRPGEAQWPPERWHELLSYSDEDVPRGQHYVAIANYLAGLPLTAALLLGIVLWLRGFGRDFAATLLPLVLLTALIVPLFQTLRLPHFAAMKAAFTLHGMSAVAPALLVALAAFRGRLQRVGLVVLWCAVLVIAVANAAHIALLVPGLRG